MRDTLQGFGNICDKVQLQDSLTFIALYIGLYESFADTVEGRVESFFVMMVFLIKTVNFGTNLANIISTKLRKKL